MDKWIKLSLCTDCALIIANDDDSGCADGEATRRALAENWGCEPYRIVVTGEETYFSQWDCDGCLDCCHGDRIDAVAIPEGE